MIRCYTRNGTIKVKLKATEKLVTVTSPYDLSIHGIDVDYKQMAVAKYSATKSTEKILASVNSEIKYSMQVTTYT